MASDVAVIIGTGGIGRAVARLIDPSIGIVVLADANLDAARSAAEDIGHRGQRVAWTQVDVSSRTSVRELSAFASELGGVASMVHTAGVSPTQAPVEAIIKVDLVGTALILEEFAAVIATGGAGVVVASRPATSSAPT